jgi:hypothetical protein
MKKKFPLKILLLGLAIIVAGMVAIFLLLPGMRTAMVTFVRTSYTALVSPADTASFDAATRLKPIPLSPAANTFIPRVKPTFYWNESDNAGSVAFVIHIRTEPTNQLVTEFSLQAVAACFDEYCAMQSPVELEHAKTYKWRLGAIDANGNIYWADWIVFVIQVPEMLMTPTLVYPVQAQQINAGTSVFRWRPVEGASAYEFEIYGPHGGRIGLWQLDGGVCDRPFVCSFQLPINFEREYGQYQWRVRAMSTAKESTWSERERFAYITLPQVIQIAPLDDGPVLSSAPRLRWSPNQANVYRYLVEVWSMNGTVILRRHVKAQNVCAETQCSWQIPIQLQPGTYQWRVQAKKFPNISAWTTTMLFTIGE